MPRTRREQRIYPISVRELTVSRVVDLGPGMRRITLTGAQFGAFATADGIAVPPLRNEGFDDHVKLIVPGNGQTAARPPRQVEGHLDWSGSSPAKDYTPRRWDPVSGELDLDFVRHGTGYASSWVETVHPGDTAFIAGPKSSALLPEGVEWILAGGDETALPAIARLLEEWPAGVRGQVFIEIADDTHRLDVASPEGVDVTWLPRDGAAPGTSDVLERAITSAPWWPGVVFCWLAGEAMRLKPLRTFLKVEREVPRDCLDITGYWRRTATTPDESSRPADAVDLDAAEEAAVEEAFDMTRPVVLRAAVATGVLARLERAPASVPALARELNLDAPALRGLLRYLATLDVVALDPADPALVGDGSLRLGATGELIATALDELGDPALDALDMTPERLVATLRTGAAAPTATAVTWQMSCPLRPTTATRNSPTR
ncbi:siderophore-interacting protein [Aeromicrobium sp. PE09-221]|uniref:siderophore-interacting protein n=1 Tax=Aeromicrobium sp. PE09-221 TaxID=1898043 RepID=UPI000B3E691F|nr:siderophore-interacting protein [Aeromicrobium sp. PE09-221]